MYLGMGFGQDFVGFVCLIWVWIWSPGSVSLLGFRSFPICLSLLCVSFVNRLFGTRRIAGPLVVVSSLLHFLIRLFTLFGTPWAKGGVLARDLAWWLLCRLASGWWCKAGRLRPPWAPTSPHAEEPALVPGIGLRMLYLALPSMLFPFPYIWLSFSLPLLFRQSLCTTINSMSLFVLDWSQQLMGPRNNRLCLWLKIIRVKQLWELKFRCCVAWIFNSHSK